MKDRISEMIETMLVQVGMALRLLSDEQTKMITLFLASMMVAAIASSVLHTIFLR